MTQGENGTEKINNKNLFGESACLAKLSYFTWQAHLLLCLFMKVLFVFI